MTPTDSVRSPHARALLDAEVRQFRLLEALKLAGDGVEAGLDEVEQIAARVVGHPIGRHIGGLVGQLDVDAGQRRLARVDDPALDAGAVVLGVDRGGSQPQAGDDGNRARIL